MRLKIAVSVVRSRPWAPLAFPALFFLVRAVRRSARTLVKSGISLYIDARYGSRPSEGIRRFRVHCGYTGRAGYTGRPPDCDGAFSMDELSDAKIRNATPADKEYAIADGQGLSVVVRPSGNKLWLYRYRFAG